MPSLDRVCKILVENNPDHEFPLRLKFRLSEVFCGR